MQKVRIEICSKNIEYNSITTYQKKICIKVVINKYILYTLLSISPPICMCRHTRLYRIKYCCSIDQWRRPHMSIIRRCQQLGLYYSTTRKILREDFCMKSYKIQPYESWKIVFSDEALFKLPEYINKQNYRMMWRATRGWYDCRQSQVPWDDRLFFSKVEELD